jgi:hypothetical protein
MDRAARCFYNHLQKLKTLGEAPEAAFDKNSDMLGSSVDRSGTQIPSEIADRLMDPCSKAGA